MGKLTELFERYRKHEVDWPAVEEFVGAFDFKAYPRGEVPPPDESDDDMDERLYSDDFGDTLEDEDVDDTWLEVEEASFNDLLTETEFNRLFDIAKAAESKSTGK